MNKIKIKVHSFIDIITNSSTEIYVSANNNTVKCVYELLDKFLLEKGYVYTSLEAFSVRLEENFHGRDNYYAEYDFESKEDAIEYFKEEGSYSTDIIISVNAGYEEHQPIVDCLKMLISTFRGTEVYDG